ncbi:DUF982 domain-containing protein [Rhizobium sp. R693]|uniref:DUF982 domain-containing protein n=1 Tax=Rhizobium sp. R693 TaxID=1764276 RepID=UPI000B52EB2A|nr:DUF982 domain-containing protein [Rhizobium sp. R693]OWW00393.1 hypothetical protein ATY79_02565 [Rhizobium sp. R693]
MALDLFNAPIFAQRKHFIQEIAGLDDVFDFLDEWPDGKRDSTYETVVSIVREAACRQRPVAAAEERFRQFLKSHDQFVSVEDVPMHFQWLSAGNLGGSS